MASMGVQPLGKGAARSRVGPPVAPSRPAAAAPANPPIPVVPPALSPTALLDELRSERDVARVACRGVEEALAAARAEGSALLSSARAELDASRAEAAAARSATDALRFETEALRTERDRLLSERSKLDRKLWEIQQRPAPKAPTPLRELLTARGCGTEEECHAAVAGLAALRPAELLEHLTVADSGAATAWLDRRLVLCGPHTDAPAGPAVAVRVPEDRCELQDSSSVRAAWAAVLSAARRAGIAQVTIVGGSPAYRQELRTLCERGDSLRVELVDGTARRPRHRAEADIRASDLVVLWGGTELDHSLSHCYQGRDPVLNVAHRGIVGMLRTLAAAIDARPVRR